MLINWLLKLLLLFIFSSFNLQIFFVLILTFNSAQPTWKLFIQLIWSCESYLIKYLLEYEYFYGWSVLLLIIPTPKIRYLNQIHTLINKFMIVYETIITSIKLCHQLKVREGQSSKIHFIVSSDSVWADNGNGNDNRRWRKGENLN